MEKSGHKDVASSIRLCRSIIEDAETILATLPEGEAEIPTWWTNKLAICYAYINSLRDYIVYEGVETDSEEEIDDEDSSEEEIDDKDSSEEKIDDEDSSEEEIDDEKVTIGDYTTQHFDICPSAVALYSNIVNKTDMIHLVVESMMLHDLFFKLEKFAIAMGVADAELINKAQHYADMIMSLASEMNLTSEHSYIQTVHMSKFKDLAIDESMIPPSARMMQRAS